MSSLKERLHQKIEEQRPRTKKLLKDYGDVVIHIFYEPVREFYDLEGFWIEASRIELNGTNIQKT